MSALPLSGVSRSDREELQEEEDDAGCGHLCQREREKKRGFKELPSCCDAQVQERAEERAADVFTVHMVPRLRGCERLTSSRAAAYLTEVSG